MNKINETATLATDQYLTKQSMLYLESATSCLLNTRSPQQVAKILREMADQVERYV